MQMQPFRRPWGRQQQQQAGGQQACRQADGLYWRLGMQEIPYPLSMGRLPSLFGNCTKTTLMALQSAPQAC